MVVNVIFLCCYTKLFINPDISYGLFLYHMTIINVFVNFGWIGSWLYAVVVVVISIIFAYLSTVTIGKLSFYRKKKI